MPAPVIVTYQATATIVETLDATLNPAAVVASRQVTHSAFNSSATLNATSAVQAQQAASFTKPLVAGAGTIDLTALPGTNGATVNGTGQKVQIFRVRAKTTNTAAITLTFGAANPYLLSGSAWKMALSPGQEILLYGNAATPPISGSAKNIDLAGTGTESLDISIVLG